AEGRERREEAEDLGRELRRGPGDRLAYRALPRGGVESPRRRRVERAREAREELRGREHVEAARRERERERNALEETREPREVGGVRRIGHEARPDAARPLDEEPDALRLAERL